MKRPAPVPAVGGSIESAGRVEVRPGGPEGDGVGYSDCSGRAATLSRLRASTVMHFDGPGAALDEAPPVEPPERTSGTSDPSTQRLPLSERMAA